MNAEQAGTPASTTFHAKLFSLGMVVATPGALDLLDRSGSNGMDLVLRHQHGDWGVIPEDDVEQNQFALANGCRILSSYPIGEERLWIITEADRSCTTLLLPSEY